MPHESAAVTARTRECGSPHIIECSLASDVLSLKALATQHIVAMTQEELVTVKAKVEYSEKVSHNAWTQGQNTRKYSWSSPCQIGQASHELWGKAHSREYSTSSDYSILFTMTDRLEGE